MRTFVPISIKMKIDRWKNIAAVLLCTALWPVAGGRSAEVPVSNVGELAIAGALAQPGDTIVMQDGVWPDADILFTGNGSVANPITLRPQTLGRVHLTGQSRLRISGNYLVVDGLVFTNGYRTSGDVIAFQDSSSSMASNCRLINCAVINYNPPNPTNDTKWVSLYGFSNRVENCYLKGKENVGTTLVVWVDTQPDRPNYHVITHNYFGPRPVLTAASNGGETIRVGTSEVSMNSSRTTVEENYFEQCNGDVEIISSKSCENIYRRNTFVDCEGALTLRHGNGSTVEGNFFFGHGKLLTGGVRVIGEDHKVYNNYFQDLMGTSSRAPLTLMQGLTNSPLNGYFQVKRATVAFNTFVNCTNSILIGLSGTVSGYATTLPPEDCVLANNLVLEPTGKIVDLRLSTNLTWQGNIFSGPTLNIPTNSGIARVDPLLVVTNGLYRPATNSLALGAALGTYDYVLADIDGQTRPGAKDVGADQASVAPIISSPLSATNTGPLWLRTQGTFLNWSPPAGIIHPAPLTSVQLRASANAPGEFIYDPPAGTVLNVGTGQVLSVIFTPNDLLNFTVVTQTVTINVSKGTPVIGWANPSAITHGTVLGSNQLNATSSVSGTFSYTPPVGTLLNASNGQMLSLAFTPEDTDNFAAVSRTVNINVTKATPVITWANPAIIEQGVPLGATHLNASASAPGTLVYNPPAGTILPAGSGQPVTVTFTPNNAANYNSASRTVTLNVTIGGKTVPALTWPTPTPILFGTPLSSLQLNATSSAPGTLIYTPAFGTVLPAGNAQTLSVTFTPTDAVTYTPATKSVSIDVAPLASNAIVRIAYLVPVNRTAQGHAVATLRNLARQYQKWFADQMEQNGFGRKTFVVETEPDGVTPLVNVVPVPETDSYLRGDLYGDRVHDCAVTAGLPVGMPGQIWWLVAETQVQQSDSSLGGRLAVGRNLPGLSVDSGWLASGGDSLALFRPLYQTNGLVYDGFTMPELGPFPLIQDVSFPWFEGINLSGISSSSVGAGLRTLGLAFGLDLDYRNDENFNGNLMGFGFRGIRGSFYPDRFPYNYCGLSYAAALELSVSPFFNPNRLATDLVAPTVNVTTVGNHTPVAGLLGINFNAADNQQLYAAFLTWESGAENILVGEMTLSGTNTAGTFSIPYFNALRTNRYTVTVLDQRGNRRSAATAIYPAATVNHAPQPFIRASPVVVGLGEDVMLDASGTFDAEDNVSLLEVEWDLDGDGLFDTFPVSTLFFTTSYSTLGSRLIRARMTDPSGAVSISAPVAVSVVSCNTSLSPTNRNHGYGYSTNTVKVTTGTKCHYLVINTNDWITLISSSEMVGNAILTYYAQPNPNFTRRSGNLIIGDEVYGISQDPTVCTYSLSPTNRFHGYAAGTGTVKITTKTNCTWNVINTNSWITMLSGLVGSNTATLTYAFTDNRTFGRRTGYLLISDEVFAVTQWGTNCEIVLTPYVRTHSENSETGLVTVSASGGCDWFVQNTNNWISLTSTQGSGSSSFGYTNAANYGLGSRTGVVMVGIEPFTVIQGACSYAVLPLSSNHLAGAEVGSVVVSAGPICGWSVSNTNGWITITSAQSGSGNGLVNYQLSPNPTDQSRSGTFTVAGYGYTITQSGKFCDYTVGDGFSESPGFGHGEGLEIGEVPVYAEVGCSWEVINPVSWITIFDGQTGDGSGTVLYVVDANTGPARSTTLTIAGQDYNVSQASGQRTITATDLTLASGATNSVSVILDAHGGENKLEFSLCFDTNLLAYTSAELHSGSPFGVGLTNFTSQAAQGHVGFTVAMPNGYSLPAGTGLVVQVYFRAKVVYGKPTTTISFCDLPVARHLTDALGQPVPTAFTDSSVQVIGLCTLAEAVDAPQYSWTTGNVAWVCQSVVTHDRDDAAASGVITNNGISDMETTLVGPGFLSFWWQVSSEPGSDLLRFYMDGTEQYRISGEVNWEWRTFTVPAGSHVMRWRYSKNASLAVGSDRGWVDQVVYEPAPPAITTQPANQTVDETLTATFSVVAVGQPPLTYQWLYNNVPLSDTVETVGTGTATLTLLNVHAAQAGSYSVIVGSSHGNQNSASALLTVTPFVALADALDANSFTWTSSGNLPWAGQLVTTHDGEDAARSGLITHSQSSSLQTIITGPGTVTFWWKVSSQVSKDLLTFYVNGTSKSVISGEVDWQQASFAIGSGSQTLLWTYLKNSSTSSGQDRGWVDEFRFVPSPATITTQPLGQLVDQGSNATFTVVAGGTPPFTYQWRFNGTNLAGATAATLTVPNVQPEQAGNYSVIVGNAAGSVASANALLQVNLLVPLGVAVDATNLTWTTTGTPPWVGQTAINHDGVDAARSGRIANNGTASLQTTVTGPGTVSYWWKVSSESGSDLLRFYVGGTLQQTISGEVDWTWRTVPVTGSGSQTLEWRYTKNASGLAGQDAGWVDQIYYTPSGTSTPPVMALQPTNRTVIAPATVSLNAVAIGSTNLFYQWLFNGSPLPNGGVVSGATTTNLTLTSAGAAQSGAYTVVVTNLAGSVTSLVAQLSVIAAPIITNPPASQSVAAGATVVFNVGAIGQATLTYQWIFNGTNLINGAKVSGATTAALTLTGVQAAQEGIYSVMVSNTAGTTVSSQSGGLLNTWVAAHTPAITNGQDTTLQTTVTGPGTIKFLWKVSSETNNDPFAFYIGASELARISGEVDFRAETFPVPPGAQLLQWRYSKNASISSGLDAGWLDGVEFSPTTISVPPTITNQPLNRSVAGGSTILFEAGVGGSLPLSYQWRFNGATLPNGPGVTGTGTPRLTLTGALAAQVGNYSLFVSNAAGTALSAAASLAITTAPVVTTGAPVINTPPAAQSVSENASANFTVVAGGTAPLTYRWQLNGVNLADGGSVSGSTTPSLTLTNVQSALVGNYSVVVSNAAGGASSPSAPLTVTTLGEAMGAPYLNITPAGFTSWVAQASVTHDGLSAVRTGVIPDAQSTRMEAYVDGPGTVTFWWKVSCEPANDNLRFYVGATEVARISGEVDWQQQTFAVPAGTAVLLKWRYGKDAGTSAGQDAGWVDDVKYVFTGTATAPIITSQPSSLTVFAGQTATFASGVSGSLPLLYQWRWNGTNLQNGPTVSGSTSPRLTLSGVPASQAGSYSLFVSNAAGTASSSTVALNVTPAPNGPANGPALASQPLSRSVDEGATVSFNVNATGPAPLAYQWQFNGTNLPNTAAVSGATTPSLTLSNVRPAQIGNYSVLVSNTGGYVSSAPAFLTVQSLSEVVGAPYLDFTVAGSSPSPSPSPWFAQSGTAYQAPVTNGGAYLTVGFAPTVTLPPASQSVVVGNGVSFTIGTAGTGPISVQWRVNGTNLVNGDGISGATTTTLTLANVQAAQAGNYSAAITNSVGGSLSTNALLTVLLPPTITVQPANQNVGEGTSASFTVAAVGTPTLTYQWRRNGSNLVNGGSVSGVTTTTLTLNNAQPSQAGTYTVVVSNAVGTDLSGNATMSVQAALTLGEAVNAPYLIWDTPLASPWTVQTNVTHDGEAAAQSGPIGPGGNTWLETTVIGPGTIRFWWKVSSQTNADGLNFSAGGSEWAQISGVVDWQKMSFSVPAGSVTLRWAYTKDATNSSGSDQAWVDEVDYAPSTGPSVPVILTQPVGVDVDPGTNVTLSVDVLGTPPLSYQWRYEGQNMGDGGNIFGTKTPTLTILNAQAGQAGSYDVVVRNPYSLVLSERVYVNVTPIIALKTALDTDYTNLVWFTDGFSAWRGQTNVTYDRIDSAQSGALPNNETNWIQIVVNGPGAINFWWKSSSETNHDFLRFYINGVQQAAISGETDWRQRTFPVLLPSSVLRWAYTKDAVGNAGLDRCWVDQVVYGPTAPIITNTGFNINIVDQGTTVRLSLDASGTTPFSYQWKFLPPGGTTPVPLVNSDTNRPLFPGFLTGATGSRRLVISNAQPYQSGTYYGEVYNGAGVAISPPFTVQVIPSLPLDVALNTNLVWETEGFSWWVGTTNITHDGFMAARNGTLTGSQATKLRTTVTGPGTLSFWWKASTETNVDILTFYINGSPKTTVSGNQNWQQKSFDLLDGTFVFEWEYSKSGLFTNGLDQVFLDEVVFAPILPVITNQPVSVLGVDAGSTVSFTAGVRGTPPLKYQWLYNGTPLVNGNGVSGATSLTLNLTGVQVSQGGAYSLLVTNVVGPVVTANAFLTVIPLFPLADALETTNLTWTTGSPAWVGQPVVTHDGVDAARSPVTPNSGTATMQSTVTGPGTVTFWWKVSSQLNGDYLIFYTNNIEAARISGELDWQQAAFYVGPGSQTVKWIYAKNATIVAGQDRGWVDQFVFFPVPPGITSQPAPQNVDQGTTASFSVAVSGTPPFTYQWRLGNADLSGANAATLTVTNVQPGQAGSYSVVVGNAAGTATSLGATLTVTPTVPLAVALDTTNLVWTTSGGSSPWVGQTFVYHADGDAARIAAVPDNGSNSMQTTLTGPGTLTFWWKVSSEPVNDKLIFFTNNVEAARISGEVDWQYKTFTIGSGSQTLRWAYAKNASGAGGLDRAWVDEVSFSPTPVMIVSQPASLNVDAGATASFSVTASGTPPFTYQWQWNGFDLNNVANVSGVTTSNLVITNVLLAQAASYRVIVSGAAGTVVSSNATLAVFPTLDLAEALDAPGYTWTTNGTPPWVGHGLVTHDGVDAARSGAIGNSASTTMGTTVNGPGAVSFWWKVSSETNKDLLTFYTNGTAAATISGEVDWQFKTLNFGSGVKALTWTYSKNSSGVAGQDRGWVDQFTFGPVPTVITSQPADQTIDAGATVSFSVAAIGTPPLTYQWQRNGADLANGGGVSGASSSNLVLTGTQTSQAGSYQVVVSGQGGSVASTAAGLAVYPVLTLAEALDTPGVTWTTNGSPPWIGQGAVSHDGVDAARSGAIGNSTNTSMSTILNGPGTVSFWWKVSSETNNDKLTFYTNGTAAASISGEVDWQFKILNVGSGAQTLTWTYAKNGSVVAGQDRGWVDQISFGVVAPNIITPPASSVVDAGSNAVFTVVAAATPPIFYRWFFNGLPLTDGGGLSGATNASLFVSNVQPAWVGTYSVLVSNSEGTATSAGVSLSLSTNVTLAQALDGAGITYTLGGTAQPWKGQQTVTHDGVDAAQSGFCADGTYTYIKASVTGPAPITFWWKVSSEQDHDYLRFMLDAVDQLKISGEVDWQQVTFNIPSGSHELQWRYSKNATITVGQDRAWLDEVYFGTNGPVALPPPPPPPPPVVAKAPSILIQPVSQVVDEGDTVNLSVAAAGTAPLSYRWLFNSTNIISDNASVGGSTTAQLTLFNVLAAQGGNFSVVVSNGAGSVTSAVARITVLPAIDLADAVDSLELFLTTSGDGPWTGHTVVSHDGVDAARSGLVGDGQSSVLETMLNGPGTLGFWWKVSSETNADRLTLAVNGLAVDTISGEVGWEYKSVPLPAGAQFLEWSYVKNGALAAGADRAWVDQVSFVPVTGAVGVTNIPSRVMAIGISFGANQARLTWEASPLKIYRVYYKDSLDDPAWTQLEGEINVAWKISGGQVWSDVVVATTVDVLAGQTRFYRVLEF